MEAIRECSLKHCEHDEFKMGYCQEHFLNYIRFGDPRKTVKAKKPICIMDGCTRAASVRGVCGAHYAQLTGSSAHPMAFNQNCDIDGCNRKAYQIVENAPGYKEKTYACTVHYKRHVDYGDFKFIPLSSARTTRGPCKVPGCTKKGSKENYCTRHFTNFFRFGDPLIHSIEGAVKAYLKKQGITL